MDFESLYQDIIFDHYKQPHNKADLSHIPEEEASENPSCGDSVKLELVVNPDKTIESVTFDGHGCAISMASTSMMTERLTGLSKEEALAEISQFFRAMQGEPELLEDKDELAALQGVARFPARIKCATLGWHAAEVKLQD